METDFNNIWTGVVSQRWRPPPLLRPRPPLRGDGMGRRQGGWDEGCNDGNLGVYKSGVHFATESNSVDLLI